MEDCRHYTICEWLIPAYQAFEHVGRDLRNDAEDLKSRRCRLLHKSHPLTALPLGKERTTY